MAAFPCNDQEWALSQTLAVSTDDEHSAKSCDFKVLGNFQMMGNDILEFILKNTLNEKLHFFFSQSVLH